MNSQEGINKLIYYIQEYENLLLDTTYRYKQNVLDFHYKRIGEQLLRCYFMNISTINLPKRINNE